MYIWYEENAWEVYVIFMKWLLYSIKATEYVFICVFVFIIL